MAPGVSTFGKWFIPFTILSSTALIYYSLQTSVTLSNREATQKALELRRRTQGMMGKAIHESDLQQQGRSKRWTGRDWE